MVASEIISLEVLRSSAKTSTVRGRFRGVFLLPFTGPRAGASLSRTNLSRGTEVATNLWDGSRTIDGAIEK